MTMQQERDVFNSEKLTPTWGYYRQPDGWITVSPATDLEMIQYRKLGWTPLTQYGRVEAGTLYFIENRFEKLLITGGAKEFCLAQIIQTGMAFDPPLLPVCRHPLDQYHKAHNVECWRGAQPVSFPQLEGVEIPGPFPCRFCQNPKPTEEARNQHEGVAHKTEKGYIQSGEALAVAIVKAQQQGSAQGAASLVNDLGLAGKMLKVLDVVGLTKKQREALVQAGLIGDEPDDAG